MRNRDEHAEEHNRRNPVGGAANPWRTRPAKPNMYLFDLKTPGIHKGHLPPSTEAEREKCEKDTTGT